VGAITHDKSVSSRNPTPAPAREISSRGFSFGGLVKSSEEIYSYRSLVGTLLVRP